ncbi:MAG: 2-oxoacid:acceptor oxidoreductase subunit alpha [Candidatus Woesearchaeota archaeon]
MDRRVIKEGVYSVGAIDWDRKYFDEIIYLPDGTSYNSYLIVGSEKTVLIDTVDPTKSDVLMNNLSDIKRVDYLISNHAEQDHSGTIPKVLEKYPECKIVCNELNKKMLMDEHVIDESRFLIINDYDKLSLGNKTLQFVFTPWVHWPETMCTYLIEDKILFTCDFFGSHLATSDMYVNDDSIYPAAKRYYAEIMMPFASVIVKNLQKVKALDLILIAPSHGPMYTDPSYPIELYENWTSKNVLPEVVIVYISMHGSTKKMVQRLTSELIGKGLNVQEYNLMDADIGKIAMDLVDASTLVVASPSVLGGMHPKVASALYLINALRPKTKVLTYIGSYEWGSSVVEQFKQLTNNINAERIDHLLIKGLLKEDHYTDITSLADKIIDKNLAHGTLESVKPAKKSFKDVTIVLCGEAGQGIESLFGFLTKAFKNEGYNIFATKEYMSRVRGGENSATIRISSKPVEGYVERVDILLPLDKGAIDHLSSRITKDTIIIGDKSIVKSDHEIIDIPFADVASKIGSKIFANTIACGTVIGMFNGNIELLHNMLREKFSGKPQDVIDKNIIAADKGFEYGKKIVKDYPQMSDMLNIGKDSSVNNQILVHGAESIGLGAIAGGCNFISAYPMSPSTGVLIYLASKRFDFGIIVEQAEDEISAINMAIGAWYAGARALVNSSGGGFALMCEGVSLSGMIESPLVVHIAQRPGPATGLPTRTAQEDLELALYSGHGEFCRIIYAPSDVSNGFYLTQKAFNMAAKYQVPVFVLTDQYFMDTLHNISPIDIDGVVVEEHIVKTEADYLRYKLTDTGITPRGIPGYGNGLICVDSDEHDESGHITELMDVRRKMVDKRLKRFKSIESEVLMPEFISVNSSNNSVDYKFLIISWGTTYGSVNEAVFELSRNDIAYLHYAQVYPLHPKTSSFIKKARKTIVIENNATGQFARLIRRETGLFVESILKNDGMPFSVEELVKKISEMTQN